MSEVTSTPACPETAALRALLDGSLPDEQLATVRAHVDQCSACEAVLKQMTVGSESWIGMAAGLKERDERTDGQLAAAMDRLKTDDGSGDIEHEKTDPQRTLDFLLPTDDPKLLGKLGRHEISEIIGWGGMGVVLKAYDPSLHRVVAVKVLASHLAHHAVARKRFIREAQAAAAVCHDNVVTIHAIEDGVGNPLRAVTGEPEGVSPRTSGATSGANTVQGLTPSGSPMNQTLPKIIMQFVAGGSLQERIDQEGTLELKEILRIAMQTAAGLAAAHAQGVVHRDVKPANILLENGVQRVKLTDFGLARVMDDASLTLSGVIAGTPQYMAPEQAWGRDVDARADLFSLGAVMYAMCSGHSPFRARTTMAVLKRVCEDAPRPLRAINPDVPEWLVAIIEKLLAKNPDERFQTATEVSELLGRWLAHVQQPNVVMPPVVEAVQPAPNAPQNVVRPSTGSSGTRVVRSSGQPGKADLPSLVTIARVWIPLLVLSAVAALVVVEQLRVALILGDQIRASRWQYVEPIAIALAHILAAGCCYQVFYVGWNTTGGRQRLATCIVLATVIWSFIGAIENLRQPYSIYFWPQAILCCGYLLAIVTRHVSQHGQEILLLPGVGQASQPDANVSNNVDLASSQPGKADLRGEAPLSAKVALLPMLGIAMTLAILLLLIVAAGETNNLSSFLGFAAWNLLVTFAICSVFRTAWNTSSWLIWIGAVLLLPIVGGGFVTASSYQPNPTEPPAAPQLIYAVQSMTAFALLFGLLFVRPFFVRGTQHWMRERLSGWQRLFAVACFTIIGTPLTLAVMYLVMYLPAASQDSRRPTEAGPTQKVLIDVKVPAEVTGQSNEPQRPLGSQTFPKPQLLSNKEPLLPSASGRTGNVGSPEPEGPFVIEPIYEPVLAVRRVPAKTPAAVADSHKSLQGRWIVLTLQGDEPPEVGGPSGFGGAAGAPMGAAPVAGGVGSGVVTPTQADQLRFLEFRNGVLFLNDEPQRQMVVSIQNDRELNLSNSQSVRHGVYTVEGDRLVICWSSGNAPLPRDFQPKSGQQLVVCRREWSRTLQADSKGNVAVVKLNESSKLPKAEMPLSPREAVALQSAWAEKSKTPLEVTNSIGMKLRVVPPGSFGNAREQRSGAGAMSGFGSSAVPGVGGSAGGPMGGGGAAVSHSTESGSVMNGPILVGTHEVTVAQFRQFIEDSKYITEAERSENGQTAKPHSWQKPEIEQDSDQHPVVHVSFEDALAFCHWLSLKEKKPYRLLTRREWEFCARAGSWLPVTLGPGKLAYRSQFFTTTAPVGSYSANSFGLHDFIGNVAEWAWHSDIQPNDSRRQAPNIGVWDSDPTVFCGGDFRQHIERSQPDEWLHPVATKTPSATGFRVAVDLTPASIVSLPKHWPPNQLMLSQELVRLRHLLASPDNDDANKNEAAKDSEAQKRGRITQAVWLKMLVHSDLMPYAVEWLDFEVERRMSPQGETIDDFIKKKIEDAGSEVGWQSVKLDDALRLLEQTDFQTDPIPPQFTDPVFTMPIPKAVEGRWSIGSTSTESLLFKPLPTSPAFQLPRLFRFIDFHAPRGEHFYRVRLKYRIPGVTPETMQATSWFHSTDTVQIDFDSLDRPDPPEGFPVIELKPLAPVDPATNPPDRARMNGLRRSRGAIPTVP